jgi:hypothetical protein
MSLVLQSSGGGQITIQEPTTASNFTQTLPAASGEVMVSGNQPAFSAYLSANQSVTSNVATKVTMDTEEFDTNNNFASNRFTPTVAGYYQINGGVNFGGTGISYAFVAIYKNGSVYKYGNILGFTQTAQSLAVVNSIVYLNGSTDYVELYALDIATSPIFVGGSAPTYFNGCLVRAA